MEEFIRVASLSLDNDLKALVTDRKANVNDAVQLQMLRILRGRPFNVQLNAPKVEMGGWTPNGVDWYPSEPGTYTTGSGPVPPETK